MQTLLMLTAIAGLAYSADVIDPDSCSSYPCLIFDDNFDYLDHEVWTHEINMAGGGNEEFEMYVNNRSVSYTRDGLLFIKPDLVSNWKGEDFLYDGDLDLWGMNGDQDVCTGNLNDGCRQQGDSSQILSPVMSARMRTYDNFQFKYGRVEIRAKFPKADWMWPAAWMLPWRFPYGAWPASGEMDIFEARTNSEYGDDNELTHYWTSTAMHWGPDGSRDQGMKSRADYSSPEGDGESFADDFYIFALEWTDTDIKLYNNDVLQLTVDPGSSFWDFGDFDAGLDNPWQGASKMAPFDQKFYIILNVAVGGTGGYFPDGVASNPPKPWSNDSPTAKRDFFEGRDSWYPSWTQGLDGRTSEDAALQIDYVRVYKMSADQV